MRNSHGLATVATPEPKVDTVLATADLGGHPDRAVGLLRGVFRVGQWCAVGAQSAPYILDRNKPGRAAHGTLQLGADEPGMAPLLCFGTVWRLRRCLAAFVQPD